MSPSRDSLEHWLTQGGDSRITLNGQGLNAYGYPPHPLPGLAAFGSSTASAISPGAYAAALALHQRLPDPLPASRQVDEWQRVRTALNRLPGWREQKPAIVFGRSGSHMHLLAAQLLRDARGAWPTALLVDHGETGRYVPSALAGCHFGQGPDDAKPIDVCSGRVVTVPVWASGGVLHPLTAIDEAIIRRVEQEAKGSRRLLLVVQDVSKSGFILPSVAAMLELKARYGERLTVLVDACQFRCSGETLGHYLAAGCLVAVTGSKFLTGPAFSGALLIPETLTASLTTTGLPRSLSAYTTATDWPADWFLANTLTADSNRGLLLRWEAALFELQRFSALAAGDIRRFCEHFARTLQHALVAEPRFRPLPLASLTRFPGSEPTAWDQIPTLFPFMLQQPGTDQPLRPEDTQRLYQCCRTDREGGIALGQPVHCGIQEGQPLTALRLSLGASQIAEAIHAPETVTDQALRVLERVRQKMNDR